MADPARNWTDAELREMERRIRKTYKDAQKKLQEQWDEYVAKQKDKLDTLYNAWQTAPDIKKGAAFQRYQNVLRDFTLNNQRYKGMMDHFTTELANVNQTAISYINGKMPKIYKENYNYLDPDLSGLGRLGIRFDIVDEHTIARLIKDGTIKLPYKLLDIDKDIAWNMKQLNSSLLQGLLLGESMDKIAMRILGIVGKNRNAAIRTARTMVTGAENRGRLDRYHDLEDEGAVLTKIWIATADGRTRNWHLSMDGQEVATDEPFIDGLGNELEYPGDWQAPPKTVYNCRCSMRSHLIGVKGKGGKITYMKNYPHNGLHQRQIEEEEDERGW